MLVTKKYAVKYNYSACVPNEDNNIVSHTSLSCTNSSVKLCHYF